MAAYSTIWCKLTFFSNLPKKRSPPKKPSNKKYRLSKKQKNDNLQIFNKYRNFSFPRQLVLTQRAKASA